MPKAESVRKQRFRIALAVARIGQTEWAEKRGITGPHLSMILSGVRSNKEIERKVDRFIRRTLANSKALAS